jgi:hypothetical protein
VKKEAEIEARKAGPKGEEFFYYQLCPHDTIYCVHYDYVDQYVMPLITCILMYLSGPDDPLKKLLPSWMISGGSTQNVSREREGSSTGPTLEKQQKDPPQAKQHNFNGLLHPFFRLRSSLGGKTL